MSLLDLSGKTILITGGCGAIGRVVVKTLAAHGAKVAVNDVLDEAAATEALCSDGPFPGKWTYIQADVQSTSDVQRMFDQAEERLGLADVVCCHVGVTEAAPLENYSLEAFDRVMGVNARGSFITAQEAVRRWIDRGIRGHLIFTTSWVQDVPWPEITPYCASKAAVKSMMRGFAREFADRGIRANAVAPGIVGVGMAKKQWDTDPSYRARAEKAIPLGRLQSPESVAHAFLFLCSEMASYMTGSVLLVDGGCSLYPMA